MEKIWDEVEIMEVVHGRWVDKEDYYIETGVTCSICGERYWLEDYKTLYNYCPNCGADMRERKNND
jgi:PHP family Zn ribbon phosphoesterase